MKKNLSLPLAALLVLSLFTGCGNKTSNSPAATGTPKPSASAPATASGSPTATSSGNPVKTGLAVINSIAKSASAGSSAGVAETDSTVIAVTVDTAGKIVSCAIDSVQSKINFNASGELVTPVSTQFKTKNELGYDYGMKARSGLGKEWFEEAAAFAAYVKGKTLQEVKGIAVDSSGYATGSDLKSSVTISVADFISAIDKAVSGAKDMGAKATDKLGIGIITNMAKSTNVTNGSGLAQAYSTYVAATADSGGTITSCVIDASQSNVSFDGSGKITTDLKSAPKTKNELAYGYGMKAQSGLGKEWFEEAASFASYVTGKTASQVAGIAVDDSGHATANDLKASVTITVGDFKEALAKAVK